MYFYIFYYVFLIYFIYFLTVFLFLPRDFCVIKHKIDTIKKKLKHRVETKTSLLECFSMLTANPITCGYASCLIVTKTHSPL